MRTPGSLPHSGRTSRPPLHLPGATRPGLTEDLLREASQRLHVSALVGVSLWTISFFLETWILPAIEGDPPHYHLIAHLICLTGVLLSIGLYVLSRHSELPAQKLLDAALVYMVATAALVARLQADAYLVQGLSTPEGVSWICILVLLIPIVVPNTPRRILVATLVAAAMDPLFFYGAVYWRTRELLPADHVLLWWPNFICAALAVVPARLLERLTRQVERARELGSYQMLERIGSGGMGEVWKARHQMLARPAAIKIIRPANLGGDASSARATLRRFEREAKATAALESPHTIEIYDFGIDRDGSFYYVMEMLWGFDLESLVQRFGPLPSERVVHLLAQACHSLEDAHRSGLVHRDVKPANIFTCRKAQDYDFVKVLDFGLVKSGDMTSAPASMLTLQGSAPGTPGFMAPEQLLGEDIGPAADIYALGCVGYWLLTGKLVFDADTTMKMLVSHVQDTPVPPSKRTELALSPDLEQLLLACLEKKPAARPESARELGRLLRACRTESAWDEERSRSWWSSYAPEIAREPTQPVSLTPTAPQ